MQKNALFSGKIYTAGKNLHDRRSLQISSLDVHCSHQLTKKKKPIYKQTPHIKKPTIAQLISVVQSNLTLVAERSPRISWSRLWANPPIIPNFDCLIVSPLLTVISNIDCALVQLSIRRTIIFRGMGIDQAWLTRHLSHWLLFLATGHEPKQQSWK